MTQPEYWTLHEEACARGELTYLDPESGYQVFTRLGLLERDQCCGAGCRHCPFGHEQVALAKRAGSIQQAAWLSEARPDPDTPTTLVFWSGGKDSFLAYRALSRTSDHSLVLLTTFDARSRIIAHQEFPIDEVVAQAKALNAPLIGVPLHSDKDYLDHLLPALELVPDCTNMAFGDLHLEHIRDWRIDAFAKNERTAGFDLAFPLWHVDYDVLLADLEASGAQIYLSAVSPDLPMIAVGDRFDRDLIARLPSGSDAFGENGEFHTKVVLS